MITDNLSVFKGEVVATHIYTYKYADTHTYTYKYADTHTYKS